jgi:DnaJ family protein C protein 28
MSAQQQPPRPDRASAPGGKPDPAARLRRWRDHVEELLEEARERGEFDNLEGAGKPLQLEKNVYAGDKALAYSRLNKSKILSLNILAPSALHRRTIDVEARMQAFAEEFPRLDEA